MIFRIDGEIGFLLALTPVIREWCKRNNEEKVFVETYSPEVFYGNSNVDARANVPNNGRYYDMNMIRWHELEVPVVELFSDIVLGDRDISSWKIEMHHSEEEKNRAMNFIPQSGKPVAALDFSSDKISESSVAGIKESLIGAGYEVFDVSVLKHFSWGVVRAAIDMSEIFVGSDGDGAAIAFTTDKPAIVCYSYRMPVYFPPYRNNVPFVPILPTNGLCEYIKICFPRFARGEYSKVYSQECICKDTFCCTKRDLKFDILKAIRRIGDRS